MRLPGGLEGRLSNGDMAEDTRNLPQLWMGLWEALCSQPSSETSREYALWTPRPAGLRKTGVFDAFAHVRAVVPGSRGDSWESERTSDPIWLSLAQLLCLALSPPHPCPRSVSPAFPGVSSQASQAPGDSSLPLLTPWLLPCCLSAWAQGGFWGGGGGLRLQLQPWGPLTGDPW